MTASWFIRRGIPKWVWEGNTLLFLLFDYSSLLILGGMVLMPLHPLLCPTIFCVFNFFCISVTNLYLFSPHTLDSSVRFSCHSCSMFLHHRVFGNLFFFYCNVRFKIIVDMHGQFNVHFFLYINTTNTGCNTTRYHQYLAKKKLDKKENYSSVDTFFFCYYYYLI